MRATNVRIGDTSTTNGIDIGAGLVDGALAATFGPNVLTFASGGGISGSSAIDLANGAVDRNLILRAGGNVALGNSGNDFSVVAANLSPGASLNIANRDQLTVATLSDDLPGPPVDGISAPGGVTLAANSDGVTGGVGVLINSDVIATDGDVSITDRRQRAGA